MKRYRTIRRVEDVGKVHWVAAGGWTMCGQDTDRGNWRRSLQHDADCQGCWDAFFTKGTHKMSEVS